MKAELRLPPTREDQQLLLGTQDRHLRLLRTEFNVKTIVRGEKILIDGQSEAVKRTRTILAKLIHDISQGALDIDKRLALMLEIEVEQRCATVGTERGRVEPKTSGQEKYVKAIRKNNLVFAVGPAGTGKTFLAAACAVEALRREEVERLVLTRPAVEAGENLGFLPGDIKEKVDPYLRPLYDALGDMIGRREFTNYIDTGVIEVAPLAFMRGRTLNRSFVILDEAQNTTPKQMKMFLTRLGERSRCVVTGDVTQIDLEKSNSCGLLHAMNVLRDLKEVEQIHLQQEDIVRHPLVAKIVQAYEENENN